MQGLFNPIAFNEKNEKNVILLVKEKSITKHL